MTASQIVIFNAIVCAHANQLQYSSTALAGEQSEANGKESNDSKEQMFDFRESFVIATVVSIVLLLFACLLLWLCNKTHQIVQDGDLEKGEKLFEEMLNPDYKEAFLNKKTGIYNKSDRKRFIIQKMKDDYKIKKDEEKKIQEKEEKKKERKKELERKQREDAAAMGMHQGISQGLEYDNRAPLLNNDQQLYYMNNMQPQPTDLEPMGYNPPKMRGKDGQSTMKMKAAMNNEHNQQIIAEDDQYYMAGAKSGSKQARGSGFAGQQKLNEQQENESGLPMNAAGGPIGRQQSKKKVSNSLFQKQQYQQRQGGGGGTSSMAGYGNGNNKQQQYGQMQGQDQQKMAAQRQNVNLYSGMQ